MFVIFFRFTFLKIFIRIFEALNLIFVKCNYKYSYTLLCSWRICMVYGLYQVVYFWLQIKIIVFSFKFFSSKCVRLIMSNLWDELGEEREEWAPYHLLRMVSAPKWKSISQHASEDSLWWIRVHLLWCFDWN